MFREPTRTGVVALIDVYALPRTEEAMRWISLHIVKLQRLFVDAHTADDESLQKFHPHGLGLVVPEKEVRGMPALYVVVPAHKSSTHAERTISDLSSIIRRLDGPSSRISVLAKGD